MQKLFNPKWIFLVNTLPIAVLFILFSGQFSIIKTLLNEDAIKYWKIFGISLGALGILNFAYAVYLTVKKQNVSMVYGIIALICHIAFIYSCSLNSYEIIPFNIPRWMISVDLYLYVISFLMPTLAYSLFILVAHFTPETKEHNVFHNFLISISIPFGGYSLAQTMFNLDLKHTPFVFFIVSTVVFFFFLVRTIFIIITRKANVWKDYQLILKFFIVIVFFLSVFLVNVHAGWLGDFSNLLFYMLAIFNGILICLPNLENKFYRLSLFALRSVTFSYTFYFFLVFLPLSPLAVIAIIFLGLGFLILAPLLLFIIHIAEISKDFEYLRTWFSKKSLIAISALCFLVIPTFITATYLKDKSVLNEALEYLYAPDYSKQYSIDKKSLEKTLEVIYSHQRNRGRGEDFFSNGIPYLTSYFNWIVLDNHSISKTKSDYIKQVFFGPDSSKSETEFDIRNSRVEITGISSFISTYDKSQNAWKTWVNLDITNKSDNFGEEYSTTIDLPEGCWISDYYLDIGGRREFGILSEKKTAMWVYSNITRERRDPGILHYLTGNKIAFKVFPFSRQETRKTGIEFLHKEPLKLTIDGNIIELGNEEKPLNTSVETGNFAYISAEQKQKLKTALRKPYFHFLVDASKGKEKKQAEFAKRIENFLINKPTMSENAQISFVNTYVDSPKLYEGGFYLERAIKTVLFNAYKNKSYPIIVVVTDDIQNAILEKDFSDFKFAFPESDLFFELDYNGDNVFTHSLSNNPIKRLSYGLPSFEQIVFEYKFADNSVAYLPNNDEPSIVLKNEIFEIAETEIKEKNWQSALAMQAMQMSHILHPERAAKEWQKLVKYSFLSKIMTPETSYLVVENEAQKAILRSKQKEVLSSNKFLDLDEDTQRMSEPNIWILVVLLGLVLWVLRRHLWRQ